MDVRTVGAGGGSIAHVPELTKALRVGPQSAGADPGPAAYGKGGTEPTVTDANVVLGYLPPSLAGGEIALDVDAARAAVQTVADAMGLESVEAAAAGIVDIVNENMLGGLRLVSVQQGFDPREFALVAFGGAGPLHANALGRLTGAWPVIVPPSPGRAVRAGRRDDVARSESARTVLRRFADVDDLTARSSTSSPPSGSALAEQGVPRDAADHRVPGGRPLPRAGLRDPDRRRPAGPTWTTLAAAFDAEHERLFSFLLTVDHELVNARATVTGPRPAVSPSPWSRATAPPTPPTPIRSSSRAAGWTPRSTTGPTLRAGDVITGPAIVTEMDSTTLVLPGHAATVHASGSLLIRPARRA